MMWGFQVSYYHQGFPKPAAGIDFGDALVDSRDPNIDWSAQTVRVT